MVPQKGGESCDVLRVGVLSLVSQLVHGFLHVDGVPVGDGIEDQSECAQLFFLPLSQGVSDFAAVAMMDSPCQFVALFLPVELDEDAAAERGIVDRVQDVQGLDQAAQMHEGAGACCRAVPGLQDAHDAGGLEMSQFEGSGEPHQIVPVLDDEFDVDGAFGDLPEGSVVGGLVHSPETCPADIFRHQRARTCARGRR